MDFDKIPPKVFIYESELDFIARCVVDYPNTETGGDFFGLWTKEDHPVIHYAIGPGTQATKNTDSFFQDIDYLRECGFLLHDKYGIEHVGAWHSHHKLLLSEPSSGDIATMRNALQQTGFSRFIISICNIDSNSDVAVNGFLFSYEKLHRYVTCNWTILKGKSPIRENLENQENRLLGLFTNPESENASYFVNNIETPAVRENVIIEKPELPKNSYWNKTEGQNYLKKVFDQMRSRKDLSQIELLQLPDKRVAISFAHDNNDYEIRFPDNFPKGEPEVVEKVKVNDVVKIILRPPKKQKSVVRKFIDAVTRIGEGIKLW